MLVLMKIQFSNQSATTPSDSEDVVKLIRDALKNPWPGLTTKFSVMSIGEGQLYSLVELPNDAPKDLLRRFMELKKLPAVERITSKIVLNTLDALDAF